MQAPLPLEKLNCIREIMKNIQEAVAISKKELFSLLRYLNLTMHVILQGRSFTSRLLDLSKTVEKLTDMVILNAGCRSKLCFWCHLLDNWDGFSFFYNENLETLLAFKLYTDAVPSIVFFFFFNND